MTAVLLGAYGLLLSRVVPPWLARAGWPDRAPRAAVVLWQAVVLASGLSAVGVVLAAPEEFVRARAARGAGPVEPVWVLAGALAVAAVVVLRLVVALVTVLARSRARRERHRLLVDLLDRTPAGSGPPAPGGSGRAPGGAPVRVLDGPVPLAYCVPGRAPRVVLSDAALARLTAPQVAAVVAHERAHLRARHDLVLEFFTAVHRAVPRPLRSGAALGAVPALLEMLADDAARRQVGAAPLRAALADLGGVSSAVSPAAADDAAPVAGGAGTDRARRLARLAPGAPPPSGLVAAAAYGAAAALLVVPTVAVVVPWLAAALPAAPLP